MPFLQQRDQQYENVCWQKMNEIFGEAKKSNLIEEFWS
jgi:hypothetical protein